MTESRTERSELATEVVLAWTDPSVANPLLECLESLHPGANLVYLSRPRIDHRTDRAADGGDIELPTALTDAFPHSALVGPALSDTRQHGASLRPWLEVLARRADAVMFADGWATDPECVLEYASALLSTTPTFTTTGSVLTETAAADLLSQTHATRLQSNAITPLAEAETWTKTFAQHRPKDRQLAATARTSNTAYFASFAAHTGWLRYSNLPGTRDRRRQPFSDLINDLLNLSANSSVNVRTFRLDSPQGNPFHYGLTDPNDIEQLVKQVIEDGYFAIVNETVDQHDGGVSGVSLNSVVEFAPDATPRSVERTGACRTSIDMANKILKIVYGAATTVPAAPGQRVEFSCHPHRVGPMRSSTLTWEAGPDQSALPAHPPRWPNDFSRHIGDKTFGLIIAHLCGAAVPHTKVINRRVAPFEFGTPTGTNEWWIRTAPTEAQPGLFTTDRGWRDPFELLAKEDPGRLIASVLSQESVDAVWSGASAPNTGLTGSLLEGVPGFGDDFMLGRQSAQPIPADITKAVTDEIERLEDALGRVRVEWVWDGQRVWIVQLHHAGAPGQNSLSHGEATIWLPYDPADGLDDLRRLVARAGREGAGVLVTRPVGVTSHVGDILRKANVPGRFDE
ncbi:hypothetical protein [Nocardioides rubriscoriae]|uniref:hypothetical protein n=1 Tax=Nocardioides rubriscoriae TaxID=642762 RepID=UPI0011E021D8|nr:hypothetical protein [Nocardioides rubriscoriae]